MPSPSESLSTLSPELSDDETKRPAKLAILQPIGRDEGELNSLDFRSQLAATDGSDIEVDFHSDGGDIIEGLAIYDAMSQHPGTVTTRVLGGAYSIAADAFMAGDNREMAENSFLMIHNGHAQMAEPASGEASALREYADKLQGEADTLEKMNDRQVGIFTAKTGLPEAQIREMMDAETFLSANEAMELGFATSVIPSVKMSASLRPDRFESFKKYKPGKYQNTNRVASAESASSPDSTDPPNPIGATSPERNPVMENSNDTSRVASLQDLERHFPKASADFLVSCQRGNFTIADAQAKHNAMQNDEMKAMNDKYDEMEASFNAMKEDYDAAKKKLGDYDRMVKGMNEDEYKAMSDDDKKMYDAMHNSDTYEEMEMDPSGNGLRPVVGPGGPIRNAQFRQTRRNAAVASVRGSGPTPAKMSARLRWQQEVKEYTKAGFSGVDAVRKARLGNPELHAELLNEANT